MIQVLIMREKIKNFIKKSLKKRFDINTDNLDCQFIFKDNIVRYLNVTFEVRDNKIIPEKKWLDKIEKVFKPTYKGSY